LKKLLELKDAQVLKESLCQASSTFEVLEFYGDSVLYEKISNYLMTTRRFMDPNLMTKLRTQVIKNSNLSEVYDLLDLRVLIRDELVPSFHKDGPSIMKAKADVVEAMIGEMAEYDKECAALRDFTAFIAYIGERSFFQLQSAPPRRPIERPARSPAPPLANRNQNPKDGNKFPPLHEGKPKSTVPQATVPLVHVAENKKPWPRTEVLQVSPKSLFYIGPAPSAGTHASTAPKSAAVAKAPAQSKVAARSKPKSSPYQNTVMKILPRPVNVGGADLRSGNV
jgi:hypothetical protein